MSACPICGKPAEEKHRPFCSKRCSDVDLGRWLSESYRIPTPEDDPETEIDPDRDVAPPQRH